MASLGTFAVSVYAVQNFSASGLGVYSLFFSAFLLASVVPRSIVFIPCNVQLLALEPKQRRSAYSLTLPPGSAVSLLSGLFVLIAIPSAIQTGHVEFVGPMTVTAFVTAWLSPLQDHIRHLLHLGEASWGAAVVSVVQAIVVGVALVLAVTLDLDPIWIPFGALVIANLLSLSTGIAIAKSKGDALTIQRFQIRELISSGKWFLLVNIITRVADFVGRLAIVWVATAAVLGVAEGARVASRPLAVFLLGISAVVVPKSMEAGHDGSHQTAQRISRLFGVGVVVASVLYLLAGGLDWAGNPMVDLVPIAFTVDGLVPAMIIATALQSVLLPKRGEMTGGGREREMSAIESVASVGYVLSCALAGEIGAFAIPIGIGAQTLLRWFGYQSVLPRHYRSMRGTAPSSGLGDYTP